MKNKVKSKSVAILIIALAFITSLVSLSTIMILYKTAVDTTKSALSDIADDESMMIDFLHHSSFSEDSILKFLKGSTKFHQIIGNSGELVVAEFVNDSIHFLIRQSGQGNLPIIDEVRNSSFATPIKKALSGKHGSVQDLDYKGEEVLAGYTYYKDLGWGIVAKIDLAEFRVPYYQAVYLSLTITIILIIFAVFLLIKTTKPMLETISQDEYFLGEAQTLGKLGIVTYDFRNKKINASTELIKICGINPDKSDNPDEWEKILPLAAIQDFKANINKKSLFSNEIEIIRANDNALRWLSIEGEIFFNKNNTPVKLMGAAIDITERKLNEISLFREKEQLQVTLESIGDAVIVTDLNGNIIMLNKITEELTEWSREEAFGKSLSDVFKIVNDITNEPCENPVEKVLKTGTIVGLANHTALISKSGKRIIIADSGSPIKDKSGNIFGVILVFRDETKKHLAEQAIIASEEKFRLMYEHSPLPYQSLDENGNFIEVNKAWSDTLGYNHDEIVGKWFGDILPVDYKTAFRERFPKFKEAGEVQNEFLIYHKNGHLKTVAFHGKIGYDVNHNFKQTHCIMRDITEQKKLENKLKESSEQWFSTFNSITDYIMVLSKNHDILNVNQSVLDMTGKKRDEIINRKCFEIMHGTDKPLPNCPCSLVNVSKKMESSEINEYGKYYHVTSWPIFDDKGEIIGYSHSHRDITNIKEAQTSLDETNRKLLTLMSNLQGMAYTCLNDSKWTLNFVSKGCKELTGYEPSELIMNKLVSFEEIIYHEDRKYVRQVVDKALENYKHYELTYRIVTKNNEVKWVWEKGTGVYNGHNEITSLEGFISDITEQKLNEITLLESEERFKRAIELAPIPIMIHSQDGKVMAISKEWTEITGYKPNEIPSINDWVEKAYGQDSPKIFDTIKKLYVMNQKTEEGEFKIKTKDGRLRIWDFSSAPLGKLLNGQKMIISMANDITERKQMEEELINAKNKAEESDYLKSAFLANMSHEIRTPMNAILGFSQLLKYDDVTVEERQEYVSFIDQRGKDLLNIINDILDISKLDANQIKLFFSSDDVNKLLMDVLTVFLANDVHKKLDKVNLRIGSKLETNSIIKSDFARLKQILVNLIGNALKFTDVGFVEFGCSVQSDMLLFYVKDSGIGIPIHQQKLIFERFRQAEEKNISRKFGGTGLGLSISKGLVDLLKGKIWVESFERQGSTFYFTIPYEPAIRDKEKSVNVNQEHFDWSEKHILIVEDDEFNARLLENFLKKTKIGCIFAVTGNDAIDLYKSNPNIDLVLMDIQLPDISGYDAIKAILEYDRDAVIIAQTAHAFMEDETLAIQSGCSDFISKPIEKNKFLNLLEKYLK